MSNNPNFPGRLIVKGESDKTLVRTIQKRLNERGCGPVKVDGDYGTQTFNAVKLFQARFTDNQGLPLVIDGKIGSISWAALFGSVPTPKPTQTSLITKVLEIASSQVGIMENPPGSNRGPVVDEYLNRVGLNANGGNYAWCAAFVYWCFDEASKNLNRTNPAIKTAGAIAHWNKAVEKGITSINTQAAVSNPALVKPGQAFIISTGGGKGHIGFVEAVIDGKLVTIEGNTNDGGSREGIGVFRRTSRKIADINKGFVDYSKA